jgi:glucose-1-phosphate cytidylyltransferase
MTDLSKYTAVILCGGQGTRIRSVSESYPKPLIDVGGRPILWHIMKIYSYHGVRKFVLCLGYKGETIIDYFENYHTRTHDFTMKIKHKDKKQFHLDHANDKDVDDWEITFALTGEATMTGGRLKRIRRYIDQDMFFCTYGDGVSDINIHDLVKYHTEKGKTATLTGVHLPTTFGIVEADEDGLIHSFREKPVMGGMINGGYFVFNTGIFDHIDGDDTVLEELPFKRLVRNNELAMYPHEGFWHCMDTYKDYSALNKMWTANQAPWKIW